MAQPDYLICMECETPCYIFEWSDGHATEAMCAACGNDDPTAFATEEEYEEMSAAEGGEDEDE